ncbi:[weak similarity to] virulence plasmid 28.1 kDaA protein [Bathymodiolus azoricus thioautotrophic gill symbiont]|uniref:[weak similarity to] virulence plasmid 28.1 kDaA protein n=1 Tax=Bathymodiolus azoricus thioautotrophic gill symbiont TaxID=235205 RepID=A0A1H6JYR3_9GAMM|nr:[weak similarity to] virulence plasmid 28.1 kDaA protein [Bathymodiolus azoricus thioautotrophic gill symbiont]
MTALALIKVTLTQFIDNAIEADCIEKTGDSYYATIKYSLLTDTEKSAQIIELIDASPSKELFAIIDQLLMTGANNRSLMLFANINVKHSKQFAVKNKSGAFLYKNKKDSLFLNLQSKKIKQSGIISSHLFYSTPLLTKDSFVTQDISADVSKKIFTEFLKGGYITPLTSIDGSGGFAKAFSSLVNAFLMLYGFANTDKFIQDMKVGGWTGLEKYLASMQLNNSSIREVFNIMCASPYVSKDFFVESLLDRKNIKNRESASASVYTALSYNKDKKLQI